MSVELRIAVLAEFELAEKICESLEKSELSQSHITIVEAKPFKEEQSIRFNGKSVEQLEPEQVQYKEFDLLFFAGRSKQVELLAKLADAGCVVIDLSGVSASLAGVPTVIPSVNETALTNLRQHNVVALPSPQISALAVSLQPILTETSIERLFVTSLLSAAYSNQVNELAGQTARLLNGIPLEDGKQRLAFDLFPADEKQSLVAMLHKVLPTFNGEFCLHSVNTPVFYGLSQMVSLSSDYLPDREQIVASWQNNDLIQFHSDKTITPVLNGEEASSEQLPQLHISRFEETENGYRFWLVCDEQHFALACLSVTLAEVIYRNGY